MVTIRIWKLVAVGLVFAWLGQNRTTAESNGKSCSKDECQRRAKAAFAFAKLKAEAAPCPPPAPTPSAPVVAPLPRPKQPRSGEFRPCGDNDSCGASSCPSNYSPQVANPPQPTDPHIGPVGGTCVGGNCSPPRSSGWYPGKFLGR